MHYFIITSIVTGIVVWQFKIFLNTKQKLRIFRQIFPENNFALNHFEDGELGITAKHDNTVLDIIINSINNYLQNNKGAVSDFHLIKDIVERNCDAKEEEIDTQIPVPLYLGLVGTMAGILVGVGFLVLSGELSNLLGTEPNGFIKFIISIFNIKANGDGVESLLGGVAIAMFSSIVGIGLTTRGASESRKCKVEVEANKNTFLSWIQATLLPKLSDGAAATLEKVSHNLNQFNSTFSQNTRDMHEAFSSVKDTYKDLSSVLNAINHLGIKDLAEYNILVYDKMKNTTDEIGLLGEHLKGVNQYLQATNGVVQKLEIVFDREITQFDERIGAIKKAVGNIDNGIGQSLNRLNENTTAHLDEFVRSSVHQSERFNKAVEAQQGIFQETITHQKNQFEEELTKQEANIANVLDKQNKALEAKSSEIDAIVVELKNLSAVKTSMSNLERATKEQNQKLDRLTQSIEKLAQMKASDGGAVNHLALVPKWVKISSFAIGGSIALSWLFLVVIKVLVLMGLIG